MLGVYLSGTGNSKYCVEKFLSYYDNTNIKAVAIEQPKSIVQIQTACEIVIGYPVQYSNIPKILYDFITLNPDIWAGKKVFIIATMAMFCGDGTGILARLLKKHGAECIGGVHIKMPDSICDEKVLKNTALKNKAIIDNANQKLYRTAQLLKNNMPTKQGLGLGSRCLGFFVQRMFFQDKTKEYSNKLKIDLSACVGCGKCQKLCPMDNITVQNGIAAAAEKCTMCYKCVNACPTKAITLLGKKVIKQYDITKYI